MAKRRVHSKKVNIENPSVATTTLLPTAQTVEIEEQKANVWAALKRLGLDQHEFVTDKLLAYVMHRGVRIDLAKENLVDLCVDRINLMAQSGYHPHEEVCQLIEVVDRDGETRTQEVFGGVCASVLHVETNGIYLGRINDEGVFFSQDDDLFLPFIEATGSKLGPVGGVTHLGKDLPVTNRLMAVLVYGELERRERQHAEAAAVWRAGRQDWFDFIDQVLSGSAD